VTKENEIEQRDLYDRPPSVGKPWTDGHVALLGDGIHAMMPVSIYAMALYQTPLF
jgi:zeaxanthin epoxidase